MNLKILYPVINGEISGGNMVCLEIIDEALKNGARAVVNSPSNGKFTDILKQRGVKIYNIDTRRTFRWDNAVRLAWTAKKEKIDLIHSHGPLGVTILSRLAGWFAAIPVISHIHASDFPSARPAVRLYHYLLNWVTSRFFCFQVIAVSEEVKKTIVKQGVFAKKIIVVHNGINLDVSEKSGKTSLETRKLFGLSQRQLVIGQVGRLCKFKGQHTLIASALKVIKRFPEAVFMIVGEDLENSGRYRNELERLADDLGVRKAVIFTGYRADIMDLMRAFDIFVLPSLDEGLSVAILEAMAAEKAVITTSVGGNPEIVIDSQTGILLEPENPDKLAEAIIYYLEHPEISQRMGRQGYCRVKEYFSLKRMLDKIIKVYKKIL